MSSNTKICVLFCHHSWKQMVDFLSNCCFFFALAEHREMLEKGIINIVIMQENGAGFVFLGNLRRFMSNFSGPAVLFRQDYTIMDTVLSAPRSSYPDIVKLTEKNVQSGNVHDMKVVPGYYTVATDRGVCYLRAQMVKMDLLFAAKPSYTLLTACHKAALLLQRLLEP